MDLLMKYNEELKADVALDPFTVHDVQLKLPGIKHKWIGRLMRHKATMFELQSEKKSTRKELIEQVIAESPIRLTQASAGALVDDHEVMENMETKIREHKIAIEFLEKIERVLTSMTFDIRNLTEIMKLETQ